MDDREGWQERVRDIRADDMMMMMTDERATRSGTYTLWIQTRPYIMWPKQLKPWQLPAMVVGALTYCALYNTAEATKIFVVQKLRMQLIIEQ